MTLKTGDVLLPNNNKHHGVKRFVVDTFDVSDGFTRIIDPEGWWIADGEVDKNYIKEGEE